MIDDTHLVATKPHMHYSRAPLAEAVINVNARLPADATLEHLRQISWGEPGQYSQPNPRIHGNVTFNAQEQTPNVIAEQTQVGWLSKDEVHQQVVQARLDGFALSKLAPYDNWAAFCGATKQHWKEYSAVARPLGVTRLSVRYINRLDLPLPFSDFREYLRTYPEVSPDLPQGLTGFLIQMQIPQEDIGAMLILNEGILESTRPDVATILLDIDLFRPVAMEPHEGDIWEALEELHTRKNMVFEACITDKTRELIK